MANTLTNVLPQLLIQSLPVLRQNAVLPRLLWSQFGAETSQQGRTIDIGVSDAATARAVTPGVTAATNQDSTPTIVSVTLDKWYESTYNLTDKDNREIMSGILPAMAVERIKAVVNQVESDILAASLKIGNAVGTAATTPFATNINVAATAQRFLRQNLAPADDTFAIIDPLAEENARVVADVFRFDGSGPQFSGVTGLLGRRLGMDWFTDQNVTTHTVGTAWVTGYALSTVSCSAGDTTVNVLNATASGTILVGDLFTMAGSTQVYSVQTAATGAATTAVVLTFFPALATAAATAAAITVIASYKQNLIFQRQCMAFASRPLAPALDAGADNMRSFSDPVSGLALTIAITRESYQSTFRASILYGVNTVRKEFGCHLLG